MHHCHQSHPLLDQIHPSPLLLPSLTCYKCYPSPSQLNTESLSMSARFWNCECIAFGLMQMLLKYKMVTISKTYSYLSCIIWVKTYNWRRRRGEFFTSGAFWLWWSCNMMNGIPWFLLIQQHFCLFFHTLRDIIDNFKNSIIRIKFNGF